ncbi:hypothetical protein Pd630_LPD07794 [Rhodococcus opacus PD630]|nr:hypothetical protein Pd630_LPD07794 [Rhodococcus opacus PD630]
MPTSRRRVPSAAGWSPDVTFVQSEGTGVTFGGAAGHPDLC